MKETKPLIGILGFVLCGALMGDHSSAAVSLSVGVEIRAQSDFYEPLTPYGEWVTIGSYGRCWRPSRMEASWRPYCDGSWQRTDAGSYWASDEPWGWATYHYGRWGFTDQYGWYWVPQIQWAPAWVSWHRGGGYIGWEPLYTSDVRVSLPRAYVFVQERHFLDPIRSSTVVVNNTTIIKQTVINQAPTTAVVEKASGHKVRALPVQEVRYKAEAPVVALQKTRAAAAGIPTSTTVRGEVGLREKKAVATPAPTQIEKTGAASRTPAVPTPTGRVTEGERAKATPSRAEPKPPAAAKEPTAPKAEKKAAGKPAPKETSAEKKAAEHQTPAERPAAPPASP